MNFSPRAFSLLELMLVVILLTVVVGIAIPNFSGSYDRIALQQQIDELAQTIRYGQNRAIASQQTYFISFFNQCAQYQLMEMLDDNPDDLRSYGTSMGRPKSLDDFQVTCPQDNISLMPNGKIDPVRIVLSTEKTQWVVSTQEQRGYVNVLRSQK